MSTLLACVAYLKSHETQRILVEMRKKYRSYGAVKGYFVLNLPTDEELLFLKGLFKKNFDGCRSVRISLLKFQEAFMGTVFEGVTLEALLEMYFGENILSKKEELDQLFEVKQNYLKMIISTISDESITNWVEKAFNHTEHAAYKFISEMYSERNTYELNALVLELQRLLHYCSLHEEGLSIPMAAGLAASNPHALDKGMPLRKLFTYYALDYLKRDMPKTLGEWDELFEAFNLRSKERPLTVLTYGLEAFDERGASLGWQSFFKRKEPLYLTALNLKQVVQIHAQSDSVHCYENPSAFFTAIRLMPDRAAVCTSGQINKSTYDVLDFLKESDHKLFYSGDFDPEGLLIADRLKQRYQKLDLSFFNETNYDLAVSNEIISEKRLKQFQNLKNHELMIISKVISEKKRVGYEEKVIYEQLFGTVQLWSFPQ